MKKMPGTDCTAVKWVLLCAVLSAPPAMACTLQDILDGVRDVIASSEFSQVRKSTSLPRDLRAAGRAYARQDYLVWQLLQPLKSTYVITREDIAQYNRQDQLVQSIRQNDFSEGVSSLLFAIFSGDSRQLEQYYEVGFSCEENTSNVHLSPSSAQAAALITGMDMHVGQEDVVVTYTESRGDEVSITFTRSTDPELLALAAYAER